ncbi:MAG: glycogen/starch synthase [Candidatus Fibromonas sp.]|jgi:starch synthase|nr:glycogen/starch synthase [Candidatus Fibromonas sp.]
MKILVVCPECYPVSDSPLARAVASLVHAYRRQGVEALNFSPFFSQFTNENDCQQGQKLVEKLGNREYSVLKSVSCGSDMFIRYDDYFNRPGIYGNPGEKAYHDNHLRFSFLASAALNYCVETGFKPDAIHVHEWGGIAGALIKTVYSKYFANTPILLTAHNIRYDYHSSPDDIPKLGLPAEGFDMDGYEFWGKVSMLKAAMLYSDRIVFTSASYMFQLLSTDSQGGMRGFLESHRKKLFSIQSGIDYGLWNIPGNSEDFKRQRKDALRAELGLDVDSSLLMYSHLDSYSGCSAQIISTILANLLNMDLQLIIGISEHNSNYSYFNSVQEKHRNKIAILPLSENDEGLYQRLVASDMFLSISFSEPSMALFLKAAAVGSIQLSNKRTQKPYIYTVPYDHNSEEASAGANAFLCEDASPDLILEQLRIAESVFHEKKSLWAKLVGNVESLKVSWDDTVKNYLLLLGSNSY